MARSETVWVDDPLRAIPVLKQRLGSRRTPDGVVSYHPDVICRESCHSVQAIVFCNRIGASALSADRIQRLHLC